MVKSSNPFPGVEILRCRRKKRDIMDDTDKIIIDVLQINCRAPYKDIARSAKISDVAVHKRIKKLEKGPIISFIALVDQKAYGKNMTAILNIKCSIGDSSKIAKTLAGIDDIREVYTTLGEYDIVAKIRTEDTNALRTLVEKQISRISGINEIRTSIVFESLKENVGMINGPRE